ncbi:MAG: SDR family oxidoreductase [Bacteroidales bacterium]|jgi:short-subunit dehydrogenase|nr:SDR family oxidoreductase [Bacteroidales bacterium]
MKNKVVIITGASSGIGRACAYEFASRRAKIVCASRNYEQLKIIEKDLKAKGSEAFAVQADVSLEEDCKNLIAQTIEKYGKIDILINNAGISMRALFKDVDLNVIRRLMDVNFWGAVYCTKYALPHILDSRGSIAGITSIAGFHGLPGRSGYSASKFALHGFLETLRIENLKNGLHVLIAAPGFTASNVRKSALSADGSPQGQSPLNESKLMPAEKVARQIAKGIIFRKRNIIISFEGKLSVLLQRVIPKSLDRLFYNHMAKEPDSPFT